MDARQFDALKDRHRKIREEIDILRTAIPAEGAINRLRVLIEEKLTIKTELRQSEADAAAEC